MRVSRRNMAAVAALLATAAAPSTQVDDRLAPWRSGVAGDLVFETSAFLKTTAYAKRDQAADQVAPSGAYGPLNQSWAQGRSDHWLIEEQRYAIDAVIAGIAWHRQDLIDRGERIFDWGFAHERPDGSFDCSNRFHSMSFFVEAAAHAALLLRASDMAAAKRAVEQNRRYRVERARRRAPIQCQTAVQALARAPIG